MTIMHVVELVVALILAIIFRVRIILAVLVLILPRSVFRAAMTKFFNENKDKLKGTS